MRLVTSFYEIHLTVVVYDINYDCVLLEKARNKEPIQLETLLTGLTTRITDLHIIFIFFPMTMY